MVFLCYLELEYEDDYEVDNWGEVFFCFFVLELDYDYEDGVVGDVWDDDEVFVFYSFFWVNILEICWEKMFEYYEE